MVGYCVLGEKKTKNRIVGQILDLITLPGFDAGADTLLKSALSYFREQQVKSVVSWVVKNNGLDKIYRDNNFIQIKKGVPYLFFAEKVVNIKEWNNIDNSTPERIHFAIGDTDIN